MGFGWLFLGYFTVSFLSLNAAGALIRLAGYGIILMALGKLRKYHDAFGLAWWATVLMLAVSAALVFTSVTEYLYAELLLSSPVVSDGTLTVLGYIEQGASFIFHALMLWAIRQIALETEVNKIAVNAVRNFVFICIYQVVYVIGVLPFDSIQTFLDRLGLISLILRFVWIVLNLILIGSCYARICDEGDVDMQKKPSRFAFVNRFREENERRAQKAAEEARAYRREKQEKRNNRKRTGGKNS